MERVKTLGERVGQGKGGEVGGRRRDKAGGIQRSVRGGGVGRGRFLVFHFLSSYITLCSTRHQINNGPTYPILSQAEQVRAVC